MTRPLPRDLNEYVSLHHGDSREVLADLADNSVDSVVTDPPYALVSVVKRFGGPNAAPAKGNEAFVRASRGFMGKTWDSGEAAHDVAFWREVLRVLKPGGHLVAFGGTRTQHRMVGAIEDAGFEIRDQLQWLFGSGFPKSHDQGNGFGTALKPACEPICLARKPLSEGTVAANVLRWGTGAINVDGCRIAAGDGDYDHPGDLTKRPMAANSYMAALQGDLKVTQAPPNTLGRWPANVIHDGSDEVLAGFPNNAGRFFKECGDKWQDQNQQLSSALAAETNLCLHRGEVVYRLKYCAKASKKDRAGSNHPTVKPIALIRYLCRLVTPPGGAVLDPFAGTGTTGKAAMLEGFKAILIEREAEYISDIVDRFAEVAAMNAPPARTLRSYQERAATYLYEHDAAFLIAPLGAGKGAAALTAIAELIRDGHRRHALVVAPKLVATTVWPAEVAEWPHLKHLRVAVLDGNPEHRRAWLATAAEREVTVIGVDLVPWLVSELAVFAGDHPLFDMLVIDETSRLKDPSGKRARALSKVAGRFRTRWGLTGTPRPNSSMDLFMPTAIITNGALWGHAFVPWQKQHFRPVDPFGRNWAALPGAEEQIAADFGTIAMTVSDDDMPDLPPINIVVTRVKLPDAVMATYQTMQRELFAAIEERTIEAVSPLVATGKCAQMANGFLYGDGNEDPVEVHSVKIDWLRELVESLDGAPLLIAYEFVEDLRTVRRAFGEVPALGGTTPGGEAKRLVEVWNAGKLPLLAFHPASAGHGINLQFGGSHMAWLSPSWSAELTEQAIARIHRPGQTRRTTVHVCIAAGTVDEMKRDRVLGKMSAQEAFRRHLERV